MSMRRRLRSLVVSRLGQPMRGWAEYYWFDFFPIIYVLMGCRA
jgi:hypothetical protein